MGNIMWVMALLELGLLALLVGIVVWAIRKKTTDSTSQDDSSDPK